MANMKEFEFKINGVEQNIKNIDTLKDSYKDLKVQTVEVITAQEVLQGIIASSHPHKGIEKIIPVYDKMAFVVDKIAKLTPVGTAYTKVAAATDKAADATKKYLDIKATRTNVQVEISELQDLQKVMHEKFQTQTKVYDEEIKAAGDNAEKRKEIEKKKADDTKQYGMDMITVQQTLTAAEEKEQGLRYVQWQQYFKKTEEVANSIKKFTSDVGNYLSTGLTAVSNIYKAEIAAIDEEMTHLKNKSQDFVKEYESQQAEVNEIKAQSAARKNEIEREVAEEFVGYTQAQIDAEVKNREATDKTTIDFKNKEREKQKALDDSLAQKQDYDKKLRDLETKKAKEQAKQEKIEKLNRKVTLMKSIGEATANVAQGITKALALGPFIGPVLAAVVGAAGAVQIGIMTKQLAKFEDGGLLRGRRHAQGGMRIEGSNIEVEGGEYVVNRQSTDKNIGLIRYINSQRRELSPADISSFFARTSQGFEPPFSRAFEAGGQLPAVDSPNTVDNEYLIDAIRSIRIEPRVAVTDINRVQSEVVSVDNWVGL